MHRVFPPQALEEWPDGVGGEPLLKTDVDLVERSGIGFGARRVEDDIVSHGSGLLALLRRG